MQSSHIAVTLSSSQIIRLPFLKNGESIQRQKSITYFLVFFIIFCPFTAAYLIFVIIIRIYTIGRRRNKDGGHAVLSSSSRLMMNSISSKVYFILLLLFPVSLSSLIPNVNWISCLQELNMLLISVQPLAVGVKYFTTFTHQYFLFISNNIFIFF